MTEPIHPVPHRFSVIGGDLRMTHLCKRLAEEGYPVNALGCGQDCLPEADRPSPRDGEGSIRVCSTLRGVAEDADVLILPMTEDLSHAISLATSLRNAGIRTQIYAEQKKFKQKIGYADKLAIPYAIFLGEDEISAGVAAVKDMKSGEQVKLTAEEAIAHIKAGLAMLNEGLPILDKGE